MMDDQATDGHAGFEERRTAIVNFGVGDCVRQNRHRCHVFIYETVRGPSTKILPDLWARIPSGQPWWLWWADTPRWSPLIVRVLSAQAAVFGRQAPVIVTHWSAWFDDRVAWMRVRQQDPVPVDWIWAVPRDAWSVARPVLQALGDTLWPDTIPEGTTGWLSDR